MKSARAHAKVNLALVVGPIREDGKHEVVTVLQAVDLYDELTLEPSPELTVDGFPGDTLVRAALERLAAAAPIEQRWRVHIEKRIPVAAGLGGGSSDAATALVVANELSLEPISEEELESIAATVGADVPFFLRNRPQLGTGDGSQLSPLHLPQDYTVLLALPADARKESTAAVYRQFDEQGGAPGFEARAAALREALLTIERGVDLARLPPNDLATSPLAEALEAEGAFRAGVTGAGPAVYGLFERRDEAEQARARLSDARAWLLRPVAQR